MSIFEKASRQRLSFNTDRGLLSVDDLWDLPLTSATGKTSLDSIAVELDSMLRTTATVSFVNPGAPKDETNQLRFDVVKRIIDVRLAERDEALQAKEKADKKQKLLGIIARKQDAELEGLPIAELNKLVESI